ncbi:glutamate receptor ionotropic, kainate 1-like [Centruroides sculpturatus]|uniref:glutamate receptor ionotropic, kainate 1-like n=1 Tax=Centruroides sculpturatus TaxID=218467 RepID=UPI000C6EF165|nr:glutamate receptor ionotropic, kainate 1-like [Centruroides sculpturatus]
MKNIEYFWINYLFLFFIFLLICTSTFCLPQVIKVGAIFEENEDYDEVFIDAINKVNKNKTLLPHSLLSAEIMKIYPSDSIQTMKATCNLLDKGVAAIFGPESPSTSNLVESVARKYDIPYIQIAWNYIRQTNSYGVNLYPHPSSLAKAYKDLTEVWKSGKFTIVYRETEALTKISRLLQYFKEKKKYCSLRQHLSGEPYEKLLKEISKNDETNIIVDLPLNELHHFLQVAEKFQLMTEYNNYLITSLDAHIENFSQFKNGLTNISSFRMINNDHTNTDVWNLNRWKPMKLKHALLYDGISLVAKALHDLDVQHPIQLEKFSCEYDIKWPTGNVTVNYIKNIHFPGLTGILKFDDQGRRVDFTLDAIQFKGKETHKIIWRRH